MQQAQNQAQSGQTLPPLSMKDLSFINDLLHIELLAAKKAYQYAHQTLEPECRQAMQQVAKQHQQNVEKLAQHIGQHVSQTLQSSVVGNQPSVVATQI